MSARHVGAHEIGQHTGSSVLHGGDFSGNAAALRAGRRLADPAAVDQAVMREVRRFEAARTRMRAALIPYITAAP